MALPRAALSLMPKALGAGGFGFSRMGGAAAFGPSNSLHALALSSSGGALVQTAVNEAHGIERPTTEYLHGHRAYHDARIQKHTALACADTHGTA